jgi:F0F1-type ATP synthase epsilon subunit
VTPDGLTILAEQALAVDGDYKDALQDAVTEARSRVEAETDEQKKAEAESILRVLEEIQ